MTTTYKEPQVSIRKLQKIILGLICGQIGLAVITIIEVLRS